MSHDRILVTGAAGFVGQHLVERLVDEGHDVTALDLEKRPPDSYADAVGTPVTYVPGSVLDEDLLDAEVFASSAPYDRIFHLAAVVGIDRYVDGEDSLHVTDVNVNGTRLLLERACGSDARFVYVSTSEIYGKNPDVPWSEDDDRVLGPPSRSRWSYSATKAVSEHAVRSVGRSDPELSTTIVRPFNLYGPRQRTQFVVPKFLRMAANGETPTVYGDVTQKRCFTYVGDFIDGLVAASERPHDGNETYNLGGTDEVEIRDLASMVLEVAGMGHRSPRFVDPRERYGDEYEEPDRRVPDIGRARRRLGWTPETPLAEGLERVYETFVD